MDWLLQQAQTASPFIAVFCLVVGPGVITILWRQMNFERVEHRKAEDKFTATTNKLAGGVERVARSFERFADGQRRQAARRRRQG